MKSRITQHWNLPRLLRLVPGAAVVVQGVNESNVMMVVVGSLFSLMAILNVGRCGARGCAMPPPVKKADASNELTYEEVAKK